MKRSGSRRSYKMATAAAVLFAALCFTAFCGSAGTEAAGESGWFAKYYFRQKDGTILKKRGLVRIGKHYYYLGRDHSRCSGFRKIKGRIYYFRKKNGRRYEKKGWARIAGDRYYFLKKHSCAAGVRKIGGKRYYFGKDGKLQISHTGFSWKGKYYTTDKYGVIHRASALQVRCVKAAWRYINAHSGAGQSAYARYRACFNYLESYLKFHPKSFSHYDFSNPEWPYAFALDVFEHDLIGDCFGFACCMAVIGRELGYRTKVIVAKEDHAFVEVNGTYIDNDGNMFFSTRSHAQYTPYKTAVL